MSSDLPKILEHLKEEPGADELVAQKREVRDRTFDRFSDELAKFIEETFKTK